MLDGRPTGFFDAGRDTASASPPDAQQKEAIRLMRHPVVLSLRTDSVQR